MKAVLGTEADDMLDLVQAYAPHRMVHIAVTLRDFEVGTYGAAEVIPLQSLFDGLVCVLVLYLLDRVEGGASNTVCRLG